METGFMVRIGPEPYICDLLERGVVWMNTTGFFAKLTDDKQRGDPDEALVRRYSPSTARTFIQLHGTQTPRFEVPIAAPLRVWKRTDRARAIYSLYAATDLGAPVDGRCLEFGDWLVVFKNSGEFVRRACAAATAMGHDIAFKAVSYVPESHSGHMGIFTKTENYRHQNEWRLVSREPVDGGHLRLVLGPLHDIADLGRLKPREL
jgi:hypothetical protein